MYSLNYYKHVANGLFHLLVKRASPIWGTLLILYLSLAIPKFLGFAPELNMRIAGFFLQALFVGIVLCDLYKLSQENEFNIPGVKERTKTWFKDFKRVFKKEATVSIEDTGAEVSAQGRIYTDFNLYENDVEKNLHLLASEIKSLKERTDEKFQDIDTKLKVLDSQIHDEVDKRKEEIKEFKGFFKRITTSGFIPEIVGLIWLFFGLAFSILPIELSGILYWI